MRKDSWSPVAVTAFYPHGQSDREDNKGYKDSPEGMSPFLGDASSSY